MFLGHYAVALGAKRAAPRASLGTLFVAAQFLDLLWPFFLLLGLEQVRVDPGNTAFTPLDFTTYPFSHSLLAAMGWSMVVGVAYFALRRQPRAALVLGLAVMSHWVLDFISHRPDLPLWPGSPDKAGLGLWNSVPATVLFEGTLFLLGVCMYVQSTRARDRTGSYALWSLIALLLLIYGGSVLGPPPPSPQAVVWTGLGQWLFVPWFYWIDRHRPVADSLRGV